MSEAVKMPAIVPTSYAQQLVNLDRHREGPTTLADAVREIGASLRQAVGAMNADDVSFELDAYQGEGRSNVRLKLRAYRHRSG
jgi:hypothetical protein